MSTQETYLKAIADAIREKEGSTGLIKASDFANRVRAISTGDSLPDGVYNISIKAQPAEGGEVSKSGAASSGVELNIEASVAENYLWKGWTEEGVLVSEELEYQFIVDRNRNLVGNFKVPSVLTISASASPTSSGTIEGVGTYTEGEIVTLKAIKATNYNFVGWKENGIIVSEDIEYSFVANENRNLIAEFVYHAPRLPSGYTEVEYIDCQGKIAFSLGMTIDSNTFRMVMDLSVYPLSGSTEYIFYASGTSTASNSKLTNIRRTSTGVIYYKTGQTATGSNPTLSASFPEETRTIFDWDQKNKIAKIGDKSYTITVYTTYTSGTASLFYPLGTTYVCLPCKLYSCNIYAGDVLKKELVPCIENSTGKAGLYDLQSNTFLGNSRTTEPDEVIAGPAV